MRQINTILCTRRYTMKTRASPGSPCALDVNSHASCKFELFQNKPNPFSEKKSVGFVIPETDEVTLSITDIDGRLVTVYTGCYPKGYNEILLDSEDLPREGAFLCQLKSSTHIATKKIMFIKN